MAYIPYTMQGAQAMRMPGIVGAPFKPPLMMDENQRATLERVLLQKYWESRYPMMVQQQSLLANPYMSLSSDVNDAARRFLQPREGGEGVLDAFKDMEKQRKWEELQKKLKERRRDRSRQGRGD